MQDKKTKMSRGFGFVIFASKDSVNSIISKSGSIEIDGKIVDCFLAMSPEKMKLLQPKNESFVKQASPKLQTRANLFLKRFHLKFDRKL